MSLRFQWHKKVCSCRVFGSWGWRTFCTVIWKWKWKKKVTEVKPTVYCSTDCSFLQDLSKETFRSIGFSGVASRVFHHVSQLFHRTINQWQQTSYKVPFWFCQLRLPGTQCLSGENYSEVSTWLSFVGTKEVRVQPVKPERKRNWSTQGFLSVLLGWKT